MLFTHLVTENWEWFCSLSWNGMEDIWNGDLGVYKQGIRILNARYMLHNHSKFSLAYKMQRERRSMKSIQQAYSTGMLASKGLSLVSLQLQARSLLDSWTHPLQYRLHMDCTVQHNIQAGWYVCHMCKAKRHGSIPLPALIDSSSLHSKAIPQQDMLIQLGLPMNPAWSSRCTEIC